MATTLNGEWCISMRPLLWPDYSFSCISFFIWTGSGSTGYSFADAAEFVEPCLKSLVSVSLSFSYLIFLPCSTGCSFLWLIEDEVFVRRPRWYLPGGAWYSGSILYCCASFRTPQPCNSPNMPDGCLGFASGTSWGSNVDQMSSSRADGLPDRAGRDSISWDTMRNQVRLYSWHCSRWRRRRSASSSPWT